MIPINDQAPVVCSQKILIQARVEQVWSVLTNISNWRSWMPNVKETRLNGSLAPETTFDWKTGGMKIHSKLHTVSPYKFFGWTGKVYGIYAIHNWVLTDLGETTEVQVSESMTGILAWLFRKMLTKTLAQDMAQSLEFLQAASEKQITKEKEQTA
ncbi:SRPBCC family protein [Adhaeribacter radiodurans]|uniref:SRPBCC family protein n=1 Tax=Adhaeribacter radiodurans TaxID=2745197 RepID=A0A7L7L5E9_9BACT|nr:SRPBCC family protein [Adhaeribacter radiodurans]QMU28031.1 SRPBCC family protein [Adhaeribacter radiodurans]